MGEVFMIKVRIQNFQSIEDAELEIDGFTVITGPNNSGKSAVMRAVRGVFTNAPAGPLVRHGAKHLSVGIAFPDGNTVLWEKGGKLNRYTLNGKELNGVGRGVPPEVAALGVSEIKAASDRVWPQIAEQFTGSLFLVNRPGSVIAEALSDVDRVGTLTEALRLSESDRRSGASELKVRRQDLQAQRDQAALYEGLDDVLTTVSNLENRKQVLDGDGVTVTELASLCSQWEKCSTETEHYAGFDETAVPEAGCATDATALGNDLAALTTLQSRHASVTQAVEATAGLDVGVVTATETQEASATLAQGEWESLQRLCDKLEAARTEADAYAVEIPALPASEQASKLGRALEVVTKYEDDVRDAADQVATLDIRLEEMDDEIQQAHKEVDTLLGSRGVCPTCNTVCVLEHAVGGEV
jgi:chromosome segregation ATPase